MSYCVYCHTNKENGKKYIGITRQAVERRWKNGKGYSTQHFSRAIKKYGWDNFEHTILMSNLTKSQACYYEQFYIKKYETTLPENGYNETLGGDGGGMYGKHHTKAAREKIGKASKMVVFSEAHKRHISESKTGIKHHLARPVYQYSKDGTFIKKWDYMNEAAKNLNISRGDISNVCLGRRKTAGGFVWSYQDRGGNYKNI